MLFKLWSELFHVKPEEVKFTCCKDCIRKLCNQSFVHFSWEDGRIFRRKLFLPVCADQFDTCKMLVFNPLLGFTQILVFGCEPLCADHWNIGDQGFNQVGFIFLSQNHSNSYNEISTATGAQHRDFIFVHTIRFTIVNNMLQGRIAVHVVLGSFGLRTVSEIDVKDNQITLGGSPTRPRLIHLSIERDNSSTMEKYERPS